LDARKYLAELIAKVSGHDIYSSEHGDFTAAVVAGQKYVSLTGFTQTLTLKKVITAYRIDSAGNHRSLSLSQVQVNDTLKRITFPQAEAFAAGEQVVIKVAGVVRAYDVTHDAYVGINLFLKKILGGLAFGCSDTEAVPYSTPKLYTVQTAEDQQVHMNLFFGVANFLGITVDIYEGPTITVAGDILDCPNLNFGSANVPSTVIKEGPTATVDGDLKISKQFPANSSGGMISHGEGEIILKKDTLYLIRISADDGEGTAAVTANFEFWEETVADETAPAAPEIAGDALTGDNTPTWTWGAVTAATRYRFKIDGAAAWTETEALTYTADPALDDGAHTFTLQAGDAAGNWSASDTFETTVDTEAPDAPVITGDELTTDDTPAFTWTEPSGAVLYRWRIDEGVWTETETAGFTSGSLADETYLLEVQAADEAGNWSVSAELEFTVDTVAPGVPVIVGEALTTDDTPDFSWAAIEGAALYRWSYDEATWTETALLGFTAAHLADASYTLYVQAKDEAGNWSVSGTLAFEVDTVAPGAVTVSGDALTTDTTPTWTWNTPAGAVVFRYKLDADEEWTETDQTSFTPAEPLADGAHTLTVQCSDLAGNWSESDVFETTVDSEATDAPTVEATTPTTDTTPTWSWNTPTGAVLFRHKLDAAAEWTETDQTEYTPGALENGEHTLVVQAKDAAGNWSASGSKTIMLDTDILLAPVVTGTTPTEDTSPTWEWDTPLGAQGFRYKLAEKGETTVVLTGPAAAVAEVGDKVSADGEEFEVTEEVTVPTDGLAVVPDPDTEKMGAVAHGYADNTKGQFTAAEVAALEAAGVVVFTGAGGTVVPIATVVKAGLLEFVTDSELTIPALSVSVTPDPDTEKLGAAAHGFTDGTKGQLTANDTPAVKATTDVVLTGEAASEIDIDDEVNNGGDPTIAFKSTENKVIPSGDLSVTPDESTDKMGAAAHGYYDGTVGQFEADYVNKAIGEVLLTGVSEGAIVIDDEVSDGAGLVFKATENKAFPADGIAVVADPATEKFRSDGNNYAVGTKGQFTGVELPSGIATLTDYWIVWSDDDYFQVSLTEGGPVDTFSTAGDTVVFTASVRKMLVAIEAAVAGPTGTVEAGVIDTITHADFSVCTNLEATTGGDDEMDLPSGIAADTDYYIVGATTNDFQVSLTEGGDPDTFTTNGNGVKFVPSVRKILVAVEAAVAGAEGNLGLGELDTLSATLIAAGFTAVTNPAAITDGADLISGLPDGLLPSTDYYMVNAEENAFQVSLTEGGDPVAFSGTGDTVVFTPSVRKAAVAATASVAGDAGNVLENTIDTWEGEIIGLTAVTNPAAFSGGADAYLDLPTGIEPATDYYIVNAEDDAFQVSLETDGTPVEFIGVGSTVVFTATVRNIAVPVAAVIAGPDGNVGIGEIDTLGTGLTSEGFTDVTNLSAASGGAETSWVETESASYTPPDPIAFGGHTLFVQAETILGNWSDSGYFEIVIIEGT
jgi:hypothetical protein